MRNIHLYLKGTYVMTIDWKWDKLIVAIIAAVMGWLTNIFVPVPGTSSALQRAPQVQGVPK